MKKSALIASTSSLMNQLVERNIESQETLMKPLKLPKKRPEKNLKPEKPIDMRIKRLILNSKAFE